MRVVLVGLLLVAVKCDDVISPSNSDSVQSQLPQDLNSLTSKLELGLPYNYVPARLPKNFNEHASVLASNIPVSPYSLNSASQQLPQDLNTLVAQLASRIPGNLPNYAPAQLPKNNEQSSNMASNIPNPQPFNSASSQLPRDSNTASAVHLETPTHPYNYAPVRLPKNFNEQVSDFASKLWNSEPINAASSQLPKNPNTASADGLDTSPHPYNYAPARLPKNFNEHVSDYASKISNYSGVSAPQDLMKLLVPVQPKSTRSPRSNDPSKCENADVLIKVWTVLSNLLGSDGKLVKSPNEDHIKFVLALIKKYLQEHQLNAQNLELANKLFLLETELAKDKGVVLNDNRPLRSMLNEYPGNDVATKMSFKFEVQNNIRPNCREAFLRLIQSAQEAYLNLANNPICQAENVKPFNPYENLDSFINPYSPPQPTLPGQYNYNLDMKPIDNTNTDEVLKKVLELLHGPNNNNGNLNPYVNPYDPPQPTPPGQHQPSPYEQYHYNLDIKPVENTNTNEVLKKVIELLKGPTNNNGNLYPYVNPYDPPQPTPPGQHHYDLDNKPAEHENINDVLKKVLELLKVPTNNNINDILTLIQRYQNNYYYNNGNNVNPPILNITYDVHNNSPNTNKGEVFDYHPNTENEPNPKVLDNDIIRGLENAKLIADKILEEQNKIRPLNEYDNTGPTNFDGNKIEPLPPAVPPSGKDINNYISFDNKQNNVPNDLTGGDNVNLYNKPQANMYNYNNFGYRIDNPALQDVLKKLQQQSNLHQGSPYQNVPNLNPLLINANNNQLGTDKLTANQCCAVNYDSPIVPPGDMELTYLLKRQQPLIYQPFYYIKYRMPYNYVAQNIKQQISRKPSHLRTITPELYKNLIANAVATEVSPELAYYPKETVQKLVMENGALVKARFIQANESQSAKVGDAMTHDVNAPLNHSRSAVINVKEINLPNDNGVANSNFGQYSTGKLLNTYENILRSPQNLETSQAQPESAPNAQSSLHLIESAGNSGVYQSKSENLHNSEAFLRNQAELLQSKGLIGNTFKRISYGRRIVPENLISSSQSGFYQYSGLNQNKQITGLLPPNNNAGSKLSNPDLNQQMPEIYGK